MHPRFTVMEVVSLLDRLVSEEGLNKHIRKRNILGILDSNDILHILELASSPWLLGMTPMRGGSAMIVHVFAFAKPP